MIVWPDGTVTGSVNVAELEAIHKAQKAMGKRRLAAIGPVESLEQLLAGPPDADEEEPTPDVEPEPEPAAETPPKATARTTKEK